MNIILITKDNFEINLDEPLNLFEEDDWDFLGTSSQVGINEDDYIGFEYFNDIQDTEFELKNRSMPRLVLHSILSLLGGCLVVATGVVIYLNTFGRDLSTSEDVIDAQKEVYTNSIVKVVGIEVDSSTLVDISVLFNNYFLVLKSEGNYDTLNSYCSNSNSNFASLETMYRESVVYSYDTNDCYARALREFGAYIELKRIESALIKDDKYYCYLTISIPNVALLYEYYMSYAYEMTKYFNVNSLDAMNITRYMLQTVSNNDLPLVQKDLVFIVSRNKVTNNYEITDDSQISSLCSELYNTSISKIATILGGNLAVTQYN